MRELELCAVGDVPDGGAIEYHDATDDHYLVILRRGEAVVVYHNECPHQGRPLNYATNRFLFTPDGELVCSHHGATFQVNSGECTAGPCIGASLVPVPVRVSEAGQVVVSLPERH